MAADFNTGVTIQGTKEEVFAILKVLHRYATEKRKEYSEKKNYPYKERRNCNYLMGVHIGGENEPGAHRLLDQFTDEELMEYIESKNCTIDVDAQGPYGVFNDLEDIKLFFEMAEAAPNAQFVGGMGGFDAGGEMFANFELKDSLLYCKYASKEPGWDESDEEWDEEDYDDEEGWDEQEPDWDEEVVYDPIAKEYIEQ